MIIFLAEGRLGNQIFQYAFIKTISKTYESAFVVGFDDLLDTFYVDDVVNFKLNNRLAKAFVLRVCKPVLGFLAYMRIISSIEVNREVVLDRYLRESTTYNLTRGLIKNVTFLKLGFFQSEEFFDEKVVKKLKVKDVYRESALEFLREIPRECHKIFVHIRRGDYADYTIFGRGTLLPIDYFKNQIDWFLHNNKNCFFIFLSDQPELIESEFDYIENKLISDNSKGVDFAIMTLCNSAILSPSSFGWWGSYMIKERGVVFVPKNWLGFGSKTDFQSQGAPSYSEKVQVE